MHIITLNYFYFSDRQLQVLYNERCHIGPCAFARVHITSVSNIRLQRQKQIISDYRKLHIITLNYFYFSDRKLQILYNERCHIGPCAFARVHITSVSNIRLLVASEVHNQRLQKIAHNNTQLFLFF